MVSSDQQNKAKKFLDLHHSSSILVLPNVWDAASTKIFELENFEAIATTSAGVASVIGYPDGQKMEFSDSLFLLKRIIECTHLPVSIDIEAGYSETVDGIIETVLKVINLGAVGINLEDSTGDCSSDPLNALYDINFQCEKISAIREMSEKMGIHLAINARTDVFLESDGNTNEKIKQTVERANFYKDAGADCIFVPDVGDFNKNIITTLVNEIDAPLNVIAGANTPPIPELDEIGVARVSFGPRPMRATFDLIRKIAKEIKNEGTYNQISNSTITYSEVNNWFSNKK